MGEEREGKTCRMEVFLFLRIIWRTIFLFGVRFTTLFFLRIGWCRSLRIGYHRENGGTLGMVPLIINLIYTLYHVGNYWVYPLLKGSNRGFKLLRGPHPKGTTIFPVRVG